MDIFRELDKLEPAPLEKARIFALLSKLRFYKNEIDKKYINELTTTLLALGMNQYISLLQNQLRRCSRNDWKYEFNRYKNDYENSLINYVSKEINSYSNWDVVDAQKLVEWAEITGACLVAIDMKANQIRKFLDGIRKIELNCKNIAPEDFKPEELVMLKIHLAYAAGRESAVKPFMTVMNLAIDCIGTGSEGYMDFKKFVKFMEGIVAYHKFYGGSDL